MSEYKKLIAILVVVGATSLSGTGAAPTRRDGTTGARKGYTADEKQLAEENLHERLIAEQKCPVEEYYDGEQCRSCTEVCGPQLDRLCTDICPGEMSENTKLIATLAVVGATSLSGTGAAPTRRDGTTGARKGYTADEIKQLAEENLHERLIAEQKCPVEEYYDGEQCRSCTEVCGPQLDRFCTHICPDFAHAQEREKLEAELRADYEWRFFIQYVIMGVLLLLVIINITLGVYLVCVRRAEQREKRQEQVAAVGESTETSLCNLDSRQSFALNQGGPRLNEPRQNEARPNEERPNEERPNEERQNELRQNEARQNATPFVEQNGEANDEPAENGAQAGRAQAEAEQPLLSQDANGRRIQANPSSNFNMI